MRGLYSEQWGGTLYSSVINCSRCSLPIGPILSHVSLYLGSQCVHVIKVPCSDWLSCECTWLACAPRTRISRKWSVDRRCYSGIYLDPALAHSYWPIIPGSFRASTLFPGRAFAVTQWYEPAHAEMNYEMTVQIMPQFRKVETGVCFKQQDVSLLEDLEV